MEPAPSLPVRSCIRYGWETFKKRPWFLIGAGLLIALVNIIISGPDDPQAWSLVTVALGILSYLVSTFVQLGATNLSLRAHDAVETASFKDLWRPGDYLRYLGTVVISTVLVVAGFILLIVPGIVIALGIMLAQYLVVDKGMRPIAAIKESWRLTKGNKWRLFLLMLALLGLNILGLLALVVGLLVTLPVSVIALVHAYRTLEGARDEAPLVPDIVPTTA